MKILIAIILFSVICQSSFDQSKLLWSIGDKDNAGTEFALAPDNDYASFVQRFGGENLVYSIGYSRPGKHWSYVLPGPLDRWAGGGYWAGFHPRHFPRIFFDLDQVPTGDTYTLIINFADANAKSGTVLMVDINGHRKEIKLEPGSGKALEGDYTSAKAQNIKIPVSATWWMSRSM